VKFKNRRMLLCSLLTLTSARIGKSRTSTHVASVYSNTCVHKKLEMGFDTDSFAVKIDNCCTRTMSFCKEDFVPGSMVPVHNLSVKGYGGTNTNITHQGRIKWKFQDDEGVTRKLLIPNSYFVPSSSIRLLSPQHMAQQMNDHYPMRRGTWCLTYDDSICLQWNQRKHTKTVQLDPKSSNVGTIWSVPGYRSHDKFCKIMANTVSGWEQEPQCYEVNLANDPYDEPIPSEYEEKGSIAEPGEQEYREHKSSFLIDGPSEKEDEVQIITSSDSEQLLRWHNKLSHVSMKRIQRMARNGYLPSNISNCKMPLCQSCLYGKQTRKPWRSKPSKNQVPTNIATRPGECVSVDQLESSTLGLIGQMKGKLTKSRYRVATVFVDHYSNLGYVYLQTTTNAAETLQAKMEFEKYTRSYGVVIEHYRADNGRFSDNLWRDDIISKGQRLSFCGVGAHHQNGRAEKRIRDAQDHARTSLICANRRWPDAIDARLWPYALRQAIDAINKTPFPSSVTGETPYEKFSGTAIGSNLEDDHPFGCPAYALDGQIQGGKRINKWASRSRLAIYIGHSPQHSRSVGLLLSLNTGLVSPQFHVKYDDDFETIRKDCHQPKSKWQIMCGFKPTIPLIEEVSVSYIPPTEFINQEAVSTNVDAHTDNSDQTDASQENIVPASTEMPQSSNIIPISTNQQAETINTTLPPTNQTTRSGRVIRPPARFDDYVALVCETESVLCVDPEIDRVHPLAMAASSDKDVMYLHEALAAPDRREFVRAMEKEIRAHTEGANWKIIKRADVPKGQMVLPSVWAMRRKRDIATNEIYKWKARINLHGGKQIKDFNYWETYAPVASWSSIRVIMNMAALNDWVTRQLDFVLAFPQAPVETDLYMEIPKGFEVKGHKQDVVLKLVNNLYGQKQAGRVWNTYLTEGLEQIGFKQCKSDPCIFWRNQTLIVLYTDDTIVTGPCTKEVDEAIKEISTVFEITHQPEVKDFLGVHIQRNTDGTIVLTQPQLIKSIITDLGLKENPNTRDIPALSSKILQKHSNSPSHNEKWHYRSVIGKLNYLEKSTRPDIAYAVHQCARFASDPREEHTKAVKVIGRYLMGTSDKGIICTPTHESVTCYCDADFSGNWDASIASDDSTTARSRTGYIVKYAGCPFIWASKLQTEIAMSSTESEYVALSQALREVIPLMRIIEELAKAGFVIPTAVPKVHCKVFEDNSGALEMARTPKMRPRTKHMNLKYHHFREAVQQGLVTIHAISTHDQLADVLTKPLALNLFRKFRHGIMGW
jgi:Reverse transcriptase (RNA-dependent DNA polymerase)/GAG-pre-integrase domain